MGRFPRYDFLQKKFQKNNYKKISTNKFKKKSKKFQKNFKKISKKFQKNSKKISNKKSKKFQKKKFKKISKKNSKTFQNTFCKDATFSCNLRFSVCKSLGTDGTNVDFCILENFNFFINFIFLSEGFVY